MNQNYKEKSKCMVLKGEKMKRNISYVFSACCIFFFTVLIAPLADAKSEIISAKVVDYGIIELQTTASTEQPDDVIINQLATSTERIPAKIGTSFGIIFKVDGPPDGEFIDLTATWLFQKDGVKNPESGEFLHQATVPFKANIGKLSLQYATFDSANDLVPGNWVIEIWHQERKLCEKKFEVYMP
jgi:hypothetical protein